MRARLALGLCVLALCLPRCGKRGDPLPPLRRTPQPVTGLRLAQRGDQLEISYVAPRAATDGARLGVLEVEILRADVAGDLAKVARTQGRKAVPGEALTDVAPLPPVGTTVRIAARALAEGRASVQTTILSLTVQPPPEAPSGLKARSSDKGVTLAWTPPAHMPTPAPVPSPTPIPSPSPVPLAPAERTGAAAPGAAPAAAPSPGAAPPAAGASPAPGPSPTPSPTPPPITTGFFVYRRAKDGAYGRPIQPVPLSAPSYEDTAALPGESWCYAVRSVASTDPLVESEATPEACLTVTDVSPPAAPAGVAVLLQDGAAEVSWSPSPETDLLHYRVYRATTGEPERIAEVGPEETAFHDTALTRGVLHVYTVTAVDKAGNESPPSSPARLSPP